MAIVYSYPTATPEEQDLLVGTEMAVQGGEDAPRTRTFTVGSVIGLLTPALNLKANIESPTFTGTVGGITKTMVGLSNVDNTTDLLKPISTATQTALNQKANIAGQVFTGVVTSPSFVKTGGLDTQFLKADGSVDSTTYTTAQNLQQVTNIDAVTTNTITIATTNDNVAALNVTASGTNSNGIYSNSNYIGINGVSTYGTAIDGSSYTGVGVKGSSYGGVGMSAFSSLGKGIEVYGNGNGTSSVEVNLGNTNRGLVINSGTSSTGNFIELDKNGVDKLVVNQQGELTATKLIKQGGISTQFLKADGTVDESIYKKIIIRSATPQGGGGSTSPMLMSKSLIPANSFTLGDFIQLRAVFSKNNTDAGGIVNISINTVDSLLGATQIATYAFTSGLVTATLTREWLVESGAIRGYYTNSSSIDGVGPIETTFLPSTTAFSISTPIWFLISVQFDSASDGYIYRGINITN